MPAILGVTVVLVLRMRQVVMVRDLCRMHIVRSVVGGLDEMCWNELHAAFRATIG